MTNDVQFLLNNTLAGSIAKKLDAQDGKTDGKISASIWNEFVQDKGGKSINNYITTESAMKSITTYAVKLAKSTSTTSDDLAKKWLDGMGTVVSKEVEEPVNTVVVPPTEEPEQVEEIKNQQPVIPQDDAPENIPTTDKNSPLKDNNPPSKDNNPLFNGENFPTIDENPPQALSNDEVSELNEKNTECKNKKVRNSDGTSTEYDENGYIVQQYDKNRRARYYIHRNPDGSVRYYLNCEDDENGYETRCINRNPDGSVHDYQNYEHDENGNTRVISCRADGFIYSDKKFDKDLHTLYRIERDADGSVKRCEVHEYDEDGHTTRDINYNADGSVKNYSVYVRDKKGNGKREIKYNADGSVKDYYDYEYDEYDENGYPTHTVVRRADGTIESEWYLF